MHIFINARDKSLRNPNQRINDRRAVLLQFRLVFRRPFLAKLFQFLLRCEPHRNLVRIDVQVDFFLHEQFHDGPVKGSREEELRREQALVKNGVESGKGAGPMSQHSAGIVRGHDLVDHQITKQSQDENFVLWQEAASVQTGSQGLDDALHQFGENFVALDETRRQELRGLSQRSQELAVGRATVLELFVGVEEVRVFQGVGSLATRGWAAVGSCDDQAIEVDPLLGRYPCLLGQVRGRVQNLWM